MTPAAQEFRDDEAGYLRWLDAHGTGWVLNVPRTSGGAVVEHRSTCRSIRTEKHSNWTGPHYYKVVSQSQEPLARWLTANWSGTVRGCGFCNFAPAPKLRPEQPRKPPSLPVPRMDSGMRVDPVKTPWPLWSMGGLLDVLRGVDPQLASWDHGEHVNQLRLKSYVNAVRHHFAPVLADREKLALSLIVDLKRAERLRRGNDVENYITPLIKGLGWNRFVYAEVEKRVGGGSHIAIGQAEPLASVPAWNGWSGRMRGKLTDADGKRAIRQSLLEATKSPLPAGPLAMHMAWRLRPTRNWVGLWKPTGDSMGPVVGESRYPKKEFHPDDDRITRLMLHRCVDGNLEQHVLDVGLWWSPAN